MSKSKKTAAKKSGSKPDAGRAQVGTKSCGLCSKTSNLTKTPCCDNWICDDEENYVMFSYARNSCHRNHDRYTLCSYHFNEGHEGDWRECSQCRKSFDTEDYVDMGTNEYNFVKLQNPPKYAPTKCAKCGTVIKRAEGGYSMKGREFFCMKCSGFDFFR